ncbi:MAG: transglycosylase SLT domain-containing protein [Alphaproteobacteria bacterium]
MQLNSILSLTLALGLSAGCYPVKVPDLTAYLPSDVVPNMRWDTHPEAAGWTRSTLLAVAARDIDLALTVPADITIFCPHYAKATLNDRRAFWVGLLSATAKYESGFNPAAVGGGGKYIGLMQISPRTAQHYHCKASTPAALKNGSANLACAVAIFAPHVAKDGLVVGAGNRGIGRDWGPYRSKAVRTEIAGWTSRQSYCQPAPP